MKIKDNIYIQLFTTFFKIGLFTFGGGWAMISIIQREIVGKWHWIEEDDFLDLLAIAFKSDPTLKSMPPVANESGEAKWMIEAALELGVPTPATAAALYARQTSRGGADDILRVVSTMRAQFGGHVTKIDEIATH